MISILISLIGTAGHPHGAPHPQTSLPGTPTGMPPGHHGGFPRLPPGMPPPPPPQMGGAGNPPLPVKDGMSELEKLVNMQPQVMSPDVMKSQQQVWNS